MAIRTRTRLGDYLTIVSDNTGGNVAYAATFNGEQDVYYVRVAPGADQLTLQSAASVKGNFAIDLPLTGSPGVEDRSGGQEGRYTISLAFNHNLASVASATTGCGTVKSSAIDPIDPTHWVVNIRATDCNAEDLTVTLTGITDDQSNTLPSASVTLGLLLGDVDGDGVVTKTDFNLTKTDNGQNSDGTNFREDVNVSGVIDRNDAKLVKQQVGTSLP